MRVTVDDASDAESSAARPVERKETFADDAGADSTPEPMQPPSGLDQDEREGSGDPDFLGFSSSARGPLRPVTESDLGVPDFLCVDEYEPLGLAHYLISGALCCFEAVTGVASGIGMDGRHYQVLLYDDTLAPDLPSVFRDFLPDSFKDVEDEVVYVPLPRCELEEQAWGWETRCSDGVLVRDPPGDKTKRVVPTGTVGWISQHHNQGVTARHAIYPRIEVGFKQRTEWTGRRMKSFLTAEPRPQPHPAPDDVEVDLAIVDVGDYPAEDDRRIASLLSTDITEKRLLDEARTALLIDIQGRIVPQTLRTLATTTASGDKVALHNLLVDAKLCVSCAKGEHVASGWALIRLLKDRDKESADYEYSPHTAAGDSGAALCMTSPGGSTTVIGFLRGKLKLRGKSPEANGVDLDGHPKSIGPQEPDGFRIFTLSNAKYLDYFTERIDIDGRTGAVFRLVHPPQMSPCLLL